MLPNVLQRKLHDARRLSRTNLSESVVVQSKRIPDGDCAGAHGSADTGRNETVGDVKSLGSDLESLGFVNSETSGQRHIELPGGRAHQAVPADIAISAQPRRDECGGIDPLRVRPAGVFLIWVRQYLIRALQVRSGQCLIGPAYDIERGA